MSAQCPVCAKADTAGRFMSTRPSPRAQAIESAAFLRDRHRLTDSRLHLDPGAGRRFALERTGERMIGAAHRHTDAKKWHVVCARPLIQEERDELVSHCLPVIAPWADQDSSSRSALVCAHFVHSARSTSSLPFDVAKDEIGLVARFDHLVGASEKRRLAVQALDQLAPALFKRKDA